MSDVNHQFLEHVLEIIGYSGDRASYVKRFLELCKKRAASSPTATTTDGYVHALEEVTRDLFERQIQAVIPHLSEAQKQELGQFLASWRNV